MKKIGAAVIKRGQGKVVPLDRLADLRLIQRQPGGMPVVLLLVWANNVDLTFIGRLQGLRRALATPQGLAQYAVMVAVVEIKGASGMRVALEAVGHLEALECVDMVTLLDGEFDLGNFLATAQPNLLLCHARYPLTAAQAAAVWDGPVNTMT